MDNMILDAKREKSRRESYQRRATVVRWLGSVCGRCGESDTRVLHICHRVPLRRSGPMMYTNSGDKLVRQVIALGESIAREKFKLLCANDHARETWETGGWRRRS